MEPDSLVVCRLGHRPGRDDRITTHVGLTARALGADRFVLAAQDSGPLQRIDEVTARFGGPFTTDRVSDFEGFRSGWDGAIAHLTMYGLPIQDEIDAIRPTVEPGGNGLAVIVGAEKVPFSVYEQADWNVAVTNQPHSEVASLAVFLDRLQRGEELDRTFEDGTHRVIPQATGKRLEER